MKETLLIEFTVENGKNTTISIPDPRSDVSKADVVTAAEEIVVKKAVLSSGNPVNGFKRAYVRTIQETELE